MSSPSAQIILQAKDLEIGYSGKVVASAQEIKLQQGELTAVIGSNGSGKSTLLKSLTGDLSPLKGEVLLNNIPIQNFSYKSLSEHFSVVLPNSHFSRNLTVYEVVSLGRNPYTNWLGLLSENDKKIISDSMETIGIEKLKNRKCEELSDGQLQKVFLARALAQDTDTIILDEPTNHLDLYHTAYVFKILKRLTQKNHKCILLATHELNLALQLCDKIILVHQSGILCESPQSLIEKGVLDTIFPKDLISFDKKTKGFRVNPS